MSKCTGCGADLRFDPTLQQLKCDSCGSQMDVSAHAETLAKEDKYDDVVEYLCPQCGGSIFTTDSTAATFCSYCGSSVVLEHRITDFQKPDGLVPFVISQEEAEAAYLAKIKKAPFAPTPLKKDKRIEKIRGIYMPYKILRYQATGQGELKSIRSYTSGSYDVRETYRDSGWVESNARLVHDGLSEFSDVISKGILPYKFDKKRAYNAAYLSGFYADKADINVDDIDALRRDEVSSEVRDSWTKKIATGTVAEVNKEPFMKLATTETYMCPVWFISNTQPNGSVSYGAVNGQTGTVAAEIPIDKKKFLGIGLIFSIVAYLLLLLTGVSFTPHMAIGIIGVLAILASIILHEEAEDLYVHNCEMDGKSVPERIVKSKPSSAKSALWIFAIFPAMIAISLLSSMFGAVGIIALLLIVWVVVKRFILMKFKFWRNLLGKDYLIPKGATVRYIWKPIVAAVFAFVIYLINPVEDLVQYSSAALVFAVTLWSYLDIISVHNQVASRKPAQLQKRGGDEV